MRSLRVLRSLLSFGALSILLMACPGINAQQASATRLVGSIAAINGRSLTVKPDSGPPATVTVADTARILETTPGAKSIASATPIHFADLAVGDRVLALVHPATGGAAPTATIVIAMKKSAIQKEHEEEEEDWQRRGIGGIVKSVDPAAGTVTIAHLATTVTIHTTPATVVRRYDPGSIQYATSKISSLAQIRPGDQLRAKGNRNAAGTEMQAEEIVAGSFRNIAGEVLSTDPAADTITVKDYATKKPLTIHVNAESQLHKLPPATAQAIAVRFKHGNGGEHGGYEHGERAEGGTHPAPSSGQGASPSAGTGHGGGNISQILQRTPVIQLSDLHHGDAVMIVATQGTPGSLTVCTLLAGIRPILEASPSAGQNLFSASWNLNGQGGGGAGGGAGGGGQGGP
ncbi:MAG: DUF5666 domain-containing protein [Acidobacteriaceae bacterium]